MKSLTFYTNMRQKTAISECHCKAFKRCFEFQHEARKIVPFKDKGRSTYIYINRSSAHLAKYRVDGCLMTDGVKCDYLLLNCEKKQAYFIELKGSDVIHAIEQIDRSIDQLKSELPGFACFARIVVTRVNTTNLEKNSKFLKLEKKVRSLNGNINKEKSGKFEETV